MPIINDIYQKRNWETIHGIAWDEFAKYIENAIKEATQKCRKCDPSSQNPPSTTPSFVLVEGNFQSENPLISITGFLLFQPQVLKYFTKKIYLVINRDTCYDRRMTTKRVSEEYFQDHLWPCYVSQNAAVLEMDNVVYIDGAMDKEKQISLVLSYLEDLPDAIQQEEQQQLKETLRQILK